MNNDKKFEDFLKDQFAKTYQGTDDDMPDRFEGWLENQQVDTLMTYADVFARESYLRGFSAAKDYAFELLGK